MLHEQLPKIQPNMATAKASCSYVHCRKCLADILVYIRNTIKLAG